MSITENRQEIQALKQRLADVERRLLLIQKSIVNGSNSKPADIVEASSSSMSDEEFHQYNIEVRAIIEKQHAADRKRSIAEWDRQYGAGKKSARKAQARSGQRAR